MIRRRTLWTWIWATLLLAACGALPEEQVARRPGLDYVAGEVLVGIASDGTARSAALEPTVLLPGARVLDTLDLTLPTAGLRAAGSATETSGVLVQRLAVPAGMSVEEACARLGTAAGIAYAEPNRIVHRAAVPDDPYFGKQWGLNNSGQTLAGNMGTLTGIAGADISAPAAWEVRHDAPLIVAMLDSGLDLQHPDLVANLWTNPGEIAGNHIDDDGNGYADDLHGWNFVYNTGVPQDDDVDGHGTHTAGIVGAVGNNGRGVSGVAWSVQLMALKFLDSGGSGSIWDAATGIRYAANNGARIVNASYTYPQACIPEIPDSTERLAIDYARGKGVLLVAAAGNYGCNNDYTPFYPASHPLANILSVAATDARDRLATWNGGGSNYGPKTVHLGAPGHNIYSTIPLNLRGAEPGGILGYGFLSGTSMAAPMTSGAAAVVWAQHPEWTYSQVSETLMATVDPLPGLTAKTVSGGRINLARALQGLSTTPEPPSNLQATVVGAAITLTWLDNASNETVYIVERALADGAFNEVQRLVANSTTFADTSAADGNRWRYRVKAMAGSLSSAYSNEAEATLPLQAPTGLVAVLTTSGVDLTWQDHSRGEELFAIERLAGTETVFREIATTGANVSHYSDNSARSAISYRYRVRAGKLSTGLYSDYSNQALAAHPKKPGGSSGCFIATAAWGSPWSREVTSLRRFRDQVLLESAPGRLFVAGYYRVSPPLARLIEGHDRCRAVVRWLLTPVVRLADWLAPAEAQAMGTRPAVAPAPPQPPAELLVRFQAGTTLEEIQRLIAAEGCTLVATLELGTTTVYRIVVPPSLDSATVQQRFAALAQVAAAEPNRTVGIKLPANKP